MRNRRSGIWLALLASLALGAASAYAVELTVDVELAPDEEGEHTDVFPLDAPQILAFFSSTGSAKGDKVRGVFIASDVGDRAPANTKVAEDTVSCLQDDCEGKFKLTKPTNGWPAGHYRLEISWNDKLASTTEFTIGLDDEE